VFLSLTVTPANSWLVIATLREEGLSLVNENHSLKHEGNEPNKHGSTSPVQRLWPDKDGWAKGMMCCRRPPGVTETP
jgi:hypothetical protein